MPETSPHDPEWRHLALNPATDAPMYRAPRQSEVTGFSVPRGTDLFVHRAPGGVLYFYLYHWSVYPNETNICQLTSAESARDFLGDYVARQIGQKKQ